MATLAVLKIHQPDYFETDYFERRNPKMKRNRMMRIASFLLIAVLATTCAISGTFAKYTTDFEAESSARVAKWEFGFAAEDDTPMASFDFDLFETVSDANVKTGTGENIIAPGTSGSLTVKMENKSEVAATYKLELSEVNADGIPIKYSIDGTNWKTLTEFNTAMTETTINMGGTASIVVYWQWAYYVNEAGDIDDTELGTDGDATVTTTVTVVATQKDYLPRTTLFAVAAPRMGHCPHPSGVANPWGGTT
jgi:hypothetical protein